MKKTLFIIFLVSFISCTALYGAPAADDAERANKVMALLTSTKKSIIDQGVEQLKIEPSICKNKIVLERLYKILAWGYSDKDLDILDLLNKTNDDNAKDMVIEDSFSEKEIQEILNKLKSEDEKKVLSGLDKISIAQRAVNLNSIYGLLKGKYVFTVDKRLIEATDAVFDNMPSSKFIDQAHSILFDFDRQKFDKRIAVMLSKGSVNVQKSICRYLGNKYLENRTDLIKQNTENILMASTKSPDEVFKYLSVEMLMGLKDDEINRKLADTSSLVTDITQVLESVFNTYKNNDLNSLQKVSISGMFVAAESLKAIYNNGPFSNEDGAKYGVSGTWDDVKKYIIANPCLSPETTKDFSLSKNGHVFNIGSRYYINLNNVNNIFQVGFIRDKLFKKGMIQDEDKLFYITFETGHKIGVIEGKECHNPFILAFIIARKNNTSLIGVVGSEYSEQDIE